MSPFPGPFQPLSFSFPLPLKSIASFQLLLLHVCVHTYLKHNMSTPLSVPCEYMISGLAIKHLAGSSLGEVIFPSLSSR